MLIKFGIMEEKAFDKWYDEEIKKIIKRLPNPNTYHAPTIEFPVNFSELHFFNFDNLPQDRIILHTVKFRRVRYENIPAYKWLRC